ncbi:hypothetical protein AVEN_144890-1 [Araneus ventricosus]|uniref:Uncharacterized protein n=1 Tax=Araneus ventricosus TaxID=182803 RepID=A0A4Y2EDX8_ARAVE|nr:hypothetical protein AVEN_144890-1 [Araneus ventricosus]
MYEFFGQGKLPNFSSVVPNLLRNFRSNYSHICIYSKDPSQYKPRCFLCPDAAYESILQACVPETDLQVNVTYEQAECMEKNCEINYPEGARSITGIRVKRHASDDAHNKEKSIMNLNPESTVKLERSRVNSFKISSLPKQNDSSAQALIFDDPLEEGFYEQRPEVKVHNLIVINNTEYIISRQEVFFAVEKFEISTN